ncbi:lysophospholipid acyltransferase family protein [Mycobacterium sp.]|uniref:lysophospholipid acyltransferase family protein n=1 Tax=Mycobacterium sp. TaxID=1785 RepID=UPI0031DDD64B
MPPPTVDLVVNQPTNPEAAAQPSARVQTLRSALDGLQGLIAPLIDLSRPYVSGVATLPTDGRFLLVGNHTQFIGGEVLLIPHFVRRAIGARVRTLADRRIGGRPGLSRDLMTAYGGVVGAPDAARELMRDNATILVFPGGGREIAKFKGEEYQLNWTGRAGFSRIAVENDYPIVPVGLVGGDDVYKSLFTRDSLAGRLSRAVSTRLSGNPDMAMPAMRGVGPTLIPRPQRMYLRFGQPIETTQPRGKSADAWVVSVKERTQESLEKILQELQQIRAGDPFRELNPLAWTRAAQVS